MDNADILDKVATAPAISEPTQDRGIDPIANYEKYEPLYRRAEAENVFNWVRDNYDDDAESIINLTDFFATNYGVSRENAYHNMDTYITDYIGKTVPRKNAWQQIKDGYTDGRISDKEGRLYNRLMWAEDDEAKKSIQFQIDKLESQRPSRDGNTTTGLTPWLESANNLLGTMVRPLITSAAVSALFPQSMMLTVFSGLGKAAPLIANIGAKALSTGVVFNETRKVETGLIYKDMIENGVHPDIARKNAVAHGIIAGALETASIEVLLARFPFMKKAAQNAFMKLTARERMTQGAVKAMGKIIADNALSIPIGVVSETTTEVLQEMSAIYFEKRADLQSIDDKELAKIMANKQGEFEKYFDEEIRQAKKDYYVSDEYIKECKDRIWDVAKQTAKGMAVFGLLGAGANTISDIRTNARQTGIYKNASEQLESMKSDLDKARDNLAEKKEAFQNDPLNEQKKAEYDKAKTEVADKEAAYNLTPDAAEYGEIISKRELTDEDIERLAELDARSQLRRERETEETPDWQKAPEDIEHAEPQTLDVGEQRLREIIKAYTPNLTDPETDEIVNLLNVRARALGQELDTYLSNTFQTEMARYTTDDTATVIRNGKEETVRFKGNVDFAKDGKAIITLTHKADFSTWVHELGHIFRRQIAGDLLTEAERYYGVQDGVWTVDAEERFTEDLTNYLMTRKAPNSTLEKMFRIIADALHNVYDRFTKRGEVSDDIARVFDQMFADPQSAFNTQADYNYDPDSTLFQENPTEQERAEAEAQYNEVVAKYKNTPEWLKAPNGQPTHLTERQWVQVRTPNFIRWFGDWLNDPENASKVLDPDTKEPMVVYHGTGANFDVFKPSKDGALGSGMYFAESKEYADGLPFGIGRHLKTLETFLNIRNPYSATSPYVPDNVRENYDGVINSGNGFYVAFSPEQIKSATDNVGTFSQSNPSILFQTETFEEGLENTDEIADYIKSKLESWDYEVEEHYSGLSNSRYVTVKNAGEAFGKAEDEDAEIRIADHDLPPTYDRIHRGDIDIKSEGNQRGGTNGDAEEYIDFLARIAKANGYETPEYDNNIQRAEAERAESQRVYEENKRLKEQALQNALEYAKENLPEEYKQIAEYFDKADQVHGDKRRKLRHKANAMLKDIATRYNLIPLSQRFNESNPSILFQTDTEYIDAVNSGDMAKAQAMVDARAREMGYTIKAYHGTPLSRSQITPDRGWYVDENGENKYRRQKPPFTTFKGGAYNGLIFFTQDRAKAKEIADNRSMAIPDDQQGREQWTEEGYVYEVYLKTENPFNVTDTKTLEEILDEISEIKAYDFYSFSAPYTITKEEALKILQGNNSWQVAEQKEFLDAIRNRGYDALVAKDEGVEYIAVFNPNQAKSTDPVTYDDNGNVIPLSQRFNDSHSSLLFQSAYHGSGASFDKFDTDFMGTGEGAQAFGWGIYLTQSEGIARSYAEQYRHKVQYGDGYDFYSKGEKVSTEIHNMLRNWYWGDIDQTALVRSDEGNHTEARKVFSDTMERLKEGDKQDEEGLKEFDEVTDKISQMKGISADEIKKLEDEAKHEKVQLALWHVKEYETRHRLNKETRKNFAITMLTSERKALARDIELSKPKMAMLETVDVDSFEAVKRELPDRNLYTATIPDDTGNNYLYWDKNLNDSQLNTIIENLEKNTTADKKLLKSFVTDMEQGKKSWARWRDGEAVYRRIQEILGSPKAASEFLSSLGYVGIDYPANSLSGGNKYGKRNFVIFNADDITIDNHLMWQENEEIYRDATENGEYVPDDILEKYKGNEWADNEIQAREDYKKEALEYEDDFNKFLEFNRVFDTSNRTDDYYNEVYNSAFTGEMQSRAEANRQFLDSMTHDEMEKILNIIAKTDAFRSNKVGSPHKIVDKTLYGMMNGDKALSENNYKKIKAMMKDDPDAWREFIAMAFEDQEQYELIQKQKALFPKSEVEKLRDTNRQLRQDIARKDKSLKDVNNRIADLQDTIRFWQTRLNLTKEKLEAQLEQAKEDKEWLKAKAQIEKYMAWQKAKEKMDAEKIKAGMKLEATKERLETKLADQKAYYKEKIAELRRAYNERAYYQRLIRIIFRKPPQMCDITIAKEIEAIQAQYSPSTMTDKTKARLELALMDADTKQKAKIMNMLTRKSLREMTLAEVADLADKITELRAEGVEKRQQQLLEIKEKRLDIESGLLSDLGETDKLDRTGSVESKKSKGKIWDMMKSYWWDINRITEDMGEHWEAFFKDEVGKAYQDELRQIDRRRTALLDKMKELKLTAETLSKTEQVGDKTYTHDILLHWYICMQNADSMAALVYGNFEGDPNNKALMSNIESTIREGIGKLTDNEIKLAEWMIESFSGDDRVRLWDVFRTVENRSPEMILRYFPMIRQVNKVEDVQKEPLVDLGERTTAGRAAVRKNFSLERIHDIAWQHQSPLRLGAMSIYLQAIQNQEHYIAFAQLSKDMKYIYGGISDQVIAKYGEKFYNNLNNWIDRVINPNAYKARSAQQNIFMKALSNSMAGALAGNVVTMIKQAPSMLFFLPYCNAGNMAQSLYNFAADRKAMTKFAKEKSPYLANRNIDDVLTNLNEQLADPNSKFRKARQITNALLKPIAWIDEFACVVGWNAVYTTELGNGATEEQAVAKANEALLKTQPQATAIYSPEAYNSGSDLMRTMLVFTRQANQIYQMVTADMGHLAAEKQFKQIISMGFVLGLNALLMGWIGRKFAGYGDDDESAAVDMAKDIVANLANNIPIVGQTIVPMIQRSAYTSSGYVNPISEMLNKTHRAIYKSIKAGEIDFDTAMRLITDSMGVAGLPKVMAWRAYKALKEEDIWTLFIGAPLGGKDGGK